jgi:hypothetical protein
MFGGTFCFQLNPSSPTATIFFVPDADVAFIHFWIRPDRAGPKSIDNPIEGEAPLFGYLNIFNKMEFAVF